VDEERWGRAVAGVAGGVDLNDRAGDGMLAAEDATLKSGAGVGA
jgi:hypothetical protein